MNKTIYLRDEEGPIWEKARELAGDKLSPVIVEALKKFITHAEAEARGYERIVVQFKDSEDFTISKAKSFYGKWIFPPDKPYEPAKAMHSAMTNPLVSAALASIALEENNPFTVHHYFAVAVTSKGRAVFYSWRTTPIGPNKTAEVFSVFDSLYEAAGNEEVSRVALAAIDKQGIVVEELDI